MSFSISSILNKKEKYRKFGLTEVNVINLTIFGNQVLISSLFNFKKSIPKINKCSILLTIKTRNKKKYFQILNI
jgi:hypothetical protein